MKKVSNLLLVFFLLAGCGNLYAKKISRIHFTLEPGYFFSEGTGDLKEAYRSWGFGNSDTWRLFIVGRGSRSYPSGESKKSFFPKNIKIEYSINKKFVLGFIFSRLGSYKVQGYNAIKRINNYTPLWGNLYETSGIHMTGKFQGNAYHLTVAFTPFSGANLDTAPFKIGAGLGLSMIDFKIIVSETTDLSKNGLSFIAFAGYDFYSYREFTMGINVDYKYIPFTINAFQSIGYYEDIDEQHNRIGKSLIIDFSEQKVNFGGIGFGINLGFHF